MQSINNNIQLLIIQMHVHPFTSCYMIKLHKFRSCIGSRQTSAVVIDDTNYCSQIWTSQQTVPHSDLITKTSHNRSNDPECIRELGYIHFIGKSWEPNWATIPPVCSTNHDIFTGFCVLLRCVNITRVGSCVKVSFTRIIHGFALEKTIPWSPTAS